MKVLFVGLESIGQRHLRNLFSLYLNVEILAYRKIFLSPILDKSNKIVLRSLESKNIIKKIKKFERNKMFFRWIKIFFSMPKKKPKADNLYWNSNK